MSNMSAWHEYTPLAQNVQPPLPNSTLLALPSTIWWSRIFQGTYHQVRLIYIVKYCDENHLTVHHVDVTALSIHSNVLSRAAQATSRKRRIFICTSGLHTYSNGERSKGPAEHAIVRCVTTILPIPRRSTCLSKQHAFFERIILKNSLWSCALDAWKSESFSSAVHSSTATVNLQQHMQCYITSKSPTAHRHFTISLRDHLMQKQTNISETGSSGQPWGFDLSTITT